MSSCNNQEYYYRDYPVAVIGAGPAGIAAAVQLKRFGFDVVLFEKDTPGGLLRNANLVENYPGFPRGIAGPELVNLLNQHLEAWKIDLIGETVRKLQYVEKENHFLITTDTGVYPVPIVVAASGTVPNQLFWVESLPVELRRHVFYEVYPIRDVREKEILIVGAGDAAFDYALNLAAGGRNNILIVNRGTRVRALGLLVERVSENSSIEYRENVRVDHVRAGRERALFAHLVSPGHEGTIEIDYIICAVGREPEMGYYSTGLSQQVETLKKKGIFYEIGDLVNGINRQAAIAIGNGIEAAMKIHHMI